MADYSKTKLSGPNTQFTQIPVRAPADTSAEQDATIAGVAKVAAGAAGKAYATSQGADMTGADMSLEQANQEAAAIDESIANAFTDAQVEAGGTLSSQRVSEIKDAALNEFATNDRTLLALRDRGVITTTEARARRTMNLKRALTNPINNLFRKDFLNAAGDLTGGGSGAVSAAFDFTPEEKQAAAIREQQVKAKAEYEGQVSARIAKTGKSREVVVSEMAQADADQRRVEELARIKTEREFNAIEADEYFGRSRSGVARGNAALIAELNTANGSKGLGSGDMSRVTQQVEGQYQQLMQNLNNTRGLSATTKDAEQARIEKWKAGQLAMVKAYDAAEIDKKMLAEFDTVAKKVGWAYSGEIMALKAIDPKLFDVFLKSGGNLGAIMNQTLGGDRGTQFVDAARAIGDISKLSTGGAIENKAGIATMLQGEGGLTYLEESADEPTSKVSEQMKQVYADAPEESLKMFVSGVAQMKAGKSEVIRGEMNTAMQIARDKTSFNLKTKGGNGMIEIRTGAQIGRSKRTQVMLDIPEGMKEHAGEIKQMYKVIEKHPWSWSHVSDEYMDAADAANGYLRGEWDLNTSLEQPAKASDKPDGNITDRRGRIKQEEPIVAEKLSSNEMEPRAGDVKELQELLAIEESGGAPTPEQEDRMVELLAQRIAIRDRKRSSSGVRAPGVMAVADKMADAKGSNLAKEKADPFAPIIPEGKTAPLAVKNNNPGNLRGLGIPYQGKSGEVDTASGKFSAFDSPQMGMRALARDLDVKIGRGVDTIEKIINVYSPDADPENVKRGHTAEPYIEYVVKKAGIPRDKKLTIADRAALMRGITGFEAGFDAWSDELIAEGIKLAGERGK